MSLDLSKEVKKKIPLSAVVKKAVELRGSGPRFLALCPFHQEKTPSFHVRDDVGRYKCFGCGASGDVFEFLIRLRGLSFKEAVNELATVAGLSSEKNISSAKTPNESKALLFANKVAHKYFIEQLLSQNGGLEARDYLIKERKLGATMIKQAALGFGGSSKDDFTRFLKAHGVSPDCAVSAGLLNKGPFSLVAPFLERIIFPIRQNDGQVIAFGGRSFLTKDNAVPKYVNTHANALYEKRKSFYGLYESRPAIVKGRIPCLVEGYFDAMAMWAAGVPALALCGSALSIEQAGILKRMSSRLNIAFDNDSAGLNALRHSLVLLFSQSIQASVVRLDKKDPGEYLMSEQIPALAAQIKDPVDALCFAIDQMTLGKSGDIASRIAQIDELLPIFTSIARPLARRQYVVYLANKLHEDPSLLWMEIGKRKKVIAPKKESTEQASSSPSLNEHERLLAPILLRYSELIEEARGLKGVREAFISYFLPGSLDSSLEGLIKELNRDAVILSLDESRAVIKALHEKMRKSETKAQLRLKRQELQQAEKDKDFSSMLASLKEQSEVLLSRKAAKPSKAPQKHKEKAKASVNSQTPSPRSITPVQDASEEEGWY